MPAPASSPTIARSPSPSGEQAHPAPLILSHWLSAACVLVAFAAGLAHDLPDSESARAWLLALHRQAGLTALALLGVRLLTRLLTRGPQAQPGPRLAQHAAAAAHGLLYLALLVLPLLGWALSDARGQHPHWLGWLPLPTLTATDPDLADTLEDRHRWGAWALGALVGLHIAAALWHHWVRRDGVLRAMLPSAAPRPHRPAAPASDFASSTLQGKH